MCVCILKHDLYLFSYAINKRLLKTERACAPSLFNFPIARGLSFEIYIATIKTVSACIDVTPNVCGTMDVDGPVSSSSSEDSLETQPPTPPVSNASDSTTPPAKPPRSADILPNSAPRPPEREWPYHAGLSLSSAREQAIQHWNLPKRPEYGMLARRTRTFYQGPAQWDPEGKPSVGSMSAAGFYYGGGFTIIII